MGLTRRALTAGLVLLPTASRANNKAAPYFDWRRKVKSFAELQSWIDELPCKQIDGPATFEVPYREHFFTGFARPGDESIIEAGVASNMQLSIDDAFGNTQSYAMADAVLYWRVRLEHHVDDWSVVTEYRDDGLDIDFVTNKPCVKDHNWRRIAAYCRFTVAI